MWVSLSHTLLVCFFFFQAEDGIRDYKVTGVQTCALPIFDELVVGLHLCHQVLGGAVAAFQDRVGDAGGVQTDGAARVVIARNDVIDAQRSEERRVGKECRSRWSPYH